MWSMSRVNSVFFQSRFYCCNFLEQTNKNSLYWRFCLICVLIWAFPPHGTSPPAALWWTTVYMASVLLWTSSWHFVRWNLLWQRGHIGGLSTNQFHWWALMASLAFVQCFLYSFQKSQKSLVEKFVFAGKWILAEMEPRPGGGSIESLQNSQPCPNNICHDRVLCHLKMVSFGILGFLIQNFQPCPTSTW